MSDNDRALGIMTPALPSRATGESKPLTPLALQADPMDAPFTEPVREPRDRRAAGQKAAETRRLNAAARERAEQERSHQRKPRRKKAVKKAKRQTVRQVVNAAARATGKSRAHAAPYGEAAAKNRNRPLEMKTRLNAVLEALSTMSKLEGAIFTTTMQRMENVSRGARRRIISALAQVYE